MQFSRNVIFVQVGITRYSPGSQSAIPDSNRGPFPYQGNALTAELMAGFVELSADALGVDDCTPDVPVVVVHTLYGR